MSNSTTEQVRASKNKSVIKDISFRDFSAICQEYQIIEKATRELLEMAQNSNTPDRIRVNIYKWIIEMNIGKPTQMNEINLQRTMDNPINTEITVQYVKTSEELDELKKLKQELLTMGCTEEQISNRVKRVSTSSIA